MLAIKYRTIENPLDFYLLFSSSLFRLPEGLYITPIMEEKFGYLLVFKSAKFC